MITFVTGAPGDGKTLFAVTKLIKDLVDTEVFVVTNIRIHEKELVQFVNAERDRKGMKDPFDVHQRLRLITDGDSFEFYRFRSGGLVLRSSPDYQLRERDDNDKKRLTKKAHDWFMRENFRQMRRSPEFMRPVHYYIDEVHEIFPSREWANGGRGVLYYASKHRHLHDEIFLITQQIDQVEKQLRGLISETAVVRNHLRRSVGPFKCRPLFRVKCYYGIPTPNARPFAEPSFPLDLDGPPKCYATTGALGIHSKPEEKPNGARLPWWLLPVAGAGVVLAIVAGFVALPSLGAFGARRIVTGATTEMQRTLQPNLTVESVYEDKLPKVAAAASYEPPENAPRVSENSRQPKLTVRGFVVRGRKVNVTLSDGRTVTERDGHACNPPHVWCEPHRCHPRLTAIERNFVVLDGQTLYLHVPDTRAREVRAPVAAPAEALHTVFGEGVAPPPEGASEMGGSAKR